MSDKKCPNCGYELDSWNDCVSIDNILECPECEEHFELKAVKLNKPQLTIPKSIADEIDCVVNPIGQIVLKSGILSDFTVEAISWIYKNNENGYIAIAYANPLTHDLVKVVEG